MGNKTVSFTFDKETYCINVDSIIGVKFTVTEQWIAYYGGSGYPDGHQSRHVKYFLILSNGVQAPIYFADVKRLGLYDAYVKGG